MELDIRNLLDGPKTRPVEGPGPGGRPSVLVLVDWQLQLRPPKRDDATVPICPLCSVDEAAVLLSEQTELDRRTDEFGDSYAVATRSFKCPCCSFRTSSLRPEVLERLRKRRDWMLRRETAKTSDTGPFVERPG